MGTLRVFCDLAETRSVARTAEFNRITPSGINQMVNVLEREFHERLAGRRRNFFQLTPAGEIVHRHFQEMLRLARELDRRMQQARASSGGVIELAACYSIGLHQLPPLLRQFRQDFPGIEVRLRYGLIDWVHEEVLDNAVDLGLVCYPRRLHGLTVDPFRCARVRREGALNDRRGGCAPPAGDENSEADSRYRPTV